MGALAFAGAARVSWPLRENVFVLGAANGAFSIAAIGAMMALASQGRGAREGVRMGLWGASQAIAFGGGGFVGTMLADSARWLVGSSGLAYAFVFALETVGFVVSAGLALRIAFQGAGAGSGGRDLEAVPGEVVA
jgi:BCD family chlorophyll transporter-like MFS transporter